MRRGGPRSAWLGGDLRHGYGGADEDDGQVNIDADLVGRLVAAQFPQLSDLPISASEHRGRGLGAAVNLALLNAFRQHGATIAVVLPRGGV